MPLMGLKCNLPPTARFVVISFFGRSQLVEVALSGYHTYVTDLLSNCDDLLILSVFFFYCFEVRVRHGMLSGQC